MGGEQQPIAGTSWPRSRTWLRWIGALVYPPACPGCGVITARQASFCTTCWCEIGFIERPYCEVLDIPFSYDPGPGMVCAEAIADPPVFDRLRSVAIHDGPVRHLVHGLKYRDRTDLAAMMALWMLRASDGLVAGADAIVPVPLPLHRWRFASRKFNQSAELARHLSRLSVRPSRSRRATRSRLRAGMSSWSTTSTRPMRPSPRRHGH